MVNGMELKKAFRMLAPAVPKFDTREWLYGVLVFDGVLIASDAFMLSAYDFDTTGMPVGFRIPALLVRDFVKARPAGDVSLKVVGEVMHLAWKDGAGEVHESCATTKENTNIRILKMCKAADEWAFCDIDLVAVKAMLKDYRSMAGKSGELAEVMADSGKLLVDDVDAGTPPGTPPPRDWCVAVQRLEVAARLLNGEVEVLVAPEVGVVAFRSPSHMVMIAEVRKGPKVDVSKLEGEAS